jgi:hypothetical protein
MRRLNILWIGVLAGFMALVSCTSDDDPNSGIIGATDSLQLIFSDTTTLVTYIERDDTLRTDGTDRGILGTYNDPIFGQTTSSFYSTFTSSQSFISNSSYILDSVILTLKADGGYGDLSKFTGYQVLQVFELTEDILTPPTGGYNSTDSFACNPIPIATYGFAPQFFPMGTEPAAIRIKINPSFGDRFFQGNDTINASTLKDYLKGIYVRIDPAVASMQSPGQGGIVYFKLNSDISCLKVYYRICPGCPSTPLKFPMSSSSNQRINIFRHNYANADPAFMNKLADPTDTISSDKLYLQALEGVRIKVKMPYLTSYLDSGKIIINRAEFVLPIDPGQDFNLYAEPANLMAYTINSVGQIRIMDDIYYVYYDSYYNPITQEYKIVLTQYIQQVLNNENIANEFYFDLPVLSKNTDAYRLILNSTEHATRPMKLNLTYTRIPTL